ncbi:Bxi1p [Sugiyamaella lignohabitans]|uniref:Bxi1p n=1 Tax=Sugiyamaella lignohabitans TaxID=796027 RepID=A0A161HF46_9ASCO|nr:Bxi1p [Sugiyamaella lignohabitans]ANB11051.1 Bxi1p [Sugiyamaella lignohabitans]
MSTPSAPPPQYTAPGNGAQSSEPLLVPGEAPPRRQEDDNIPDDFKYSTSVAECTLPIRHAFLRKVYTILFGQLVVTAAVGAVISQNSSVSHWVLTHIWTFYVAIFGAMGLMIGAYVKQRSYPTNMLFLGGFTLLESYCVGIISSLYDTKIVIQAVVLTLVIFGGLSLFALQTKYDFSGWQSYLGAALWGLIGFGLISIFMPYSSGVELAYSVVGALVFAGYIVVDTQLIMRRYHPEDEVAAAIALYLDIINLFLNILRILNEMNRD